MDIFKDKGRHTQRGTEHINRREKENKNQPNAIDMKRAKRLTAREAAMLNALDCLYFGASRQQWNSCGLNPEEAEKVWQEAREQLANA